MLLVSMLLTAIAFGTEKGYLIREIFSFIYKKDYTNLFSTVSELNVQYLLGVQNVILVSLSAFMIFGHDKGFGNSQSEIWTMTGIVLLYFIGKFVLYYIVNRTFFDSRDASNWHHYILLLSDFEGLLLLPLATLQVYVGFSVKIYIILVLIVLLFVKILTIFKTFNIFFGKIGGILQIILYFCTLELTPCLILYGILGK